MQHGGLKNPQGMVTNVEQRAETSTSYFESTQWAERPCPGYVYVYPIGEELAVNLGPVTYDEVACAANKLKYDKDCGTDGIPAECWRAILNQESQASTWIAEDARAEGPIAVAYFACGA